MFSHVAYTSIPVKDAARARDFYRDVLGMGVVADAPHENGRWVLMEIDSSRTQIHLDDRRDRVERPGRVALALVVDDLEGAIETLDDAGVEILGDIKQADWNPLTRYALFRDCEDNLVLVSDG